MSGAVRRLKASSRSAAQRRLSGVVKSRKPRSSGFLSLRARSGNRKIQEIDVSITFSQGARPPAPARSQPSISGASRAGSSARVRRSFTRSPRPAPGGGVTAWDRRVNRGVVSFTSRAVREPGMLFHRRDLLQLGGAAAVAGTLPGCRPRPAAPPGPAGPADYTLRIATGLVELAKDKIIATTTYNGQFPGPLVRLKEGRRVVVDIHNDTD